MYQVKTVSLMKQSKEKSLVQDVLLVVGAACAAGVVGALILAMLTLLVAPAMAGEQGAAMRQITTDEVQRGSLLLKMVSGGTMVDAPMVKTDVDIRISGMLARVSVSQQFHNPGKEWVEGIYVFPLPEDAVVDRMRIRIGERVIEGEIQETEQAKATYEKAKKAGKKASLLRQERPNIFTSAMANIAPGEMVTVEIEYQQSLHYDQGRFRLRFPLVVAPRYIPGVPLGEDNVAAFNGTGWAQNTDQVPDASNVTPHVVGPVAGPVNPVSIKVVLDAGFPLARLESSYHAVEIVRDENDLHKLQLIGHKVATDRDFELVWEPQSGQQPHAALFVEQWEDKEYALLMVMPSAQEKQAPKQVSRELILVVDTSGSMHGESIRQARDALKMALQRLTPADSFNVIQFNTNSHSLFSGAVVANPHNITRALAYVDGLDAEGGTEMLSAVNLALDGKTHENRLRQVVFLTDGSVGNEQALFAAIQQRLGSSRLFTVGIGSAPNSFFMTRAASFGRGAFSYIGKIDEVKEKMTALFTKLESPVLTDIQVTWPEGEMAEMWPQRVPDLYLGEPVVVVASLTNMSGEVVVEGRLNGQPWQRVLQLQGGGRNPGVHLLWARRKIAELMDGRARGRAESEVREDVLKVALRHKLVSKYTSLVAVDNTPVRPLEAHLQTKGVPVNLPKGWTANRVFGAMPQTATSAPMHLLIGLFALLGACLIGSRRKLAS
ncbi:Inter-alpha-trypsin inhibitor domain protein [hydrothermal vent metagenome]|uniref:Inter-alpha-trypsin inhibitor domain protein n=1 Tax=hydrothermal vent metagenome TaxID=652676 RepID=A0A3B1B1S5_9ZZZZ